MKRTTSIALMALVSFVTIGIASAQKRVFTPDHGGCTSCVGKPLGPTNLSLPGFTRFLLFQQVYLALNR
jgi:hypothetical protein